MNRADKAPFDTAMKGWLLKFGRRFVVKSRPGHVALRAWLSGISWAVCLALFAC